MKTEPKRKNDLPLPLNSHRAFVIISKGVKNFHLLTLDMKRVYMVEKRNIPIIPSFIQRISQSISTDADEEDNARSGP